MAPGSVTPLGEIEQGPSKLDSFLENNWKVLLLASLLVVFGAAGWVIVNGLRNAKETSAGEALVRAKDMGDFRDVIEGFTGTPSAGTAQLLLSK
ncbi:MAG: hypothetical protein GWO24_38455, partial [Akkermansiaceae bacterium]|nr:hypothetical protein [Akkermansiaceae bacterium]